MNSFIKKVACFLIVLVSMIFSACVDSDTDDAERILGTWQWYESSGGFAGIIQTPETTGETRQVVFEEDGTVTFYRNSEVIVSSTFTLGTEKTIFSEEPLPVMKVDGMDIIYCYSFPYEDELELQENVVDGFVHKYRQ